ncbi:MAG: carbamoyl-phosphate synthase large subunit [Vampirovibrionales bacterium]|nr:carbamoyl-phosphate synthase large subunit [Vampirovibrionales bacterium]
MMKRTDIRRILIIGAGPIVIGQACEFDYSGSQACRALMAEGYEVILVNSNPATIMTDPHLATRTYVEPLTPDVVAAIIERERPDAILPTMGGQTALNIAHALHQQGVLQRYNVELIGANFDAIHAAEDREAFKRIVEQIGLESLRSETVHSVEEADSAAESLGFPLIIRPAFTLGGSGGSVVYTPENLKRAVEDALSLSPIGQTLIEESALGWKEYEYEVMRDACDNVVIVCSVENVDPMGVHTGDSITVAPAQTLTDKEYHLLRNASLAIIRKVGVAAGGCNIQFAVHPKSGRFVVIEMNPRVSRSSALVSKATGVPIAKISAKLAVGMTLDEIQNDITRNTPACFEPTIDYVVTKIPRFSFEKFPGAATALSPQMKSVGEVMAIGLTFQESFQKALRGLEIGLSGFYFPRAELSHADLLERLKEPTANRMRWVYQALYDEVPVQTLYDLTALDPWFIENFSEIVDTVKAIQAQARGENGRPAGSSLPAISAELMQTAKRQGFGDEQIARIWNDACEGDVSRRDVARARSDQGVMPVYKAVDTCAGEFEAYTPYFYGTYQGDENEATLAYPKAERPRVMILGGGPNRIGQGIEFDYCCVHAAFALNKLGYNAIMVNSNPETVSTDYDISDRLYFEPLTPEDVLNVIRQEKPDGVIAQLGGQTPLKLAQALRDEPGVRLLGTSADSIDLAEDRDRFSQALARLGLRAPESDIARTAQEALDASRRIGFPLIARPSYVLGGQSMRIFYSEQSLAAYLEHVVQVEPDHPVLIERFLEAAKELDVDAVSDGQDVYIGAILEHVEHAGVHSGDSVCAFPTQTLSARLSEQVKEATRLLAQELQVKGLLNIQFAVKDDDLYVLEVNPRASRTAPFVCKSTGAPLIRMAVRVMLGESLADVIADERPPQNDALTHVTVKAPVFPFIKFRGSDPVLGPEMRSTGEVMGVDDNFPAAYAKAMMGAGATIPLEGSIFVSVKDSDKEDALSVARQFAEMGFRFVATSGTAAFLRANGLVVDEVQKKHEGPRNPEALIHQGLVHLVINTPIGEEALYDDSYIRKAAVERHVPMATTMAGAMAFAQAVRSLRDHPLSVRNLQELLTQSQQAALS